MKMPNSRILLM